MLLILEFEGKYSEIVVQYYDMCGMILGSSVVLSQEREFEMIEMKRK